MMQGQLIRTLSLLRPEDLFPAWRYADLLEDMDEIGPRETRRWKEGIYGLMVLWGLEADEVIIGSYGHAVSGAIDGKVGTPLTATNVS